MAAEVPHLGGSHAGQAVHHLCALHPVWLFFARCQLAEDTVSTSCICLTVAVKEVFCKKACHFHALVAILL
jgi:hypothetical protein